jgi:hypothetical protein
MLIRFLQEIQCFPLHILRKMISFNEAECSRCKAQMLVRKPDKTNPAPSVADPDPFVRGTDPDPDPSIIKQK